MIAFLDGWWLWVVFGIILVILELLTGDFLLLGLGLGTISVGALEKYYNFDFKTDLILWMVFSIAYFVFWKKFINGKVEGAKVSRHNAAIGEVGVITKDIIGLKPGKIEFELPVMGAKVWLAVSNKDIPKGKKAKIVDIKGQYLEVEPVE